MKTRLQAGQEIETLTPDELRQILNDLRDVREPAQVFDIEAKLTADANGNIDVENVFEVPLSYMMTIHRYHLGAPGATPAAPLTSANYWLMVWRNSSDPMNMFMFFPASGTIMAPTVVEEGANSGRMLRGGTKLVITGGGFPANQVLYLNMQIKLEWWKSPNQAQQ